MEAKAMARFVRLAPRKVRYVARLIKGKSVGEAINMLKFAPKAASPVLIKVIKSAVANAKQRSGVAEDKLYISKICVDQGPMLKRFRPRAMGRASPIHKRMSHITVMVREREE